VQFTEREQKKKKYSGKYPLNNQTIVTTE